MLSTFLDLVFPPNCVACRTLLPRQETLCGKCREKINLHATFFCGKCGLGLPTPRKACHKEFPYVLAAAAKYEGPVKKLIHALKFNLVTDAAEELGSLLVDYAMRSKLDLKDRLVVPIPLSKRRERERGFNQAEKITDVFAARLGLKASIAALRRIRHTQAQSKTASREERGANLIGCFEAEKDIVYGKKILLVDDVATSGITLKEAALALKKAGAGHIIGLVCAKA